MLKRIVIIASVLALVASSVILADPYTYNPEGFGSSTVGGAGGTIIYVTNLNDSGPGSFRAAVSGSSEPARIVRFQVGGVIDLVAPIWITKGYLTIDGASAAPYGGITVHGQSLNLEGADAHDVIITHMRFRRSSPNEKDCISIYNGPYNVVIDHCSLSWATDENIGINNAHDITVQWCIISENEPEWEDTSPYSKSLLAAYGATNISMHHNFFTGNTDRNPALGNLASYGARTFDVRNNLVYNFRGGSYVVDECHVNYVGNYLRYGPSFGQGMEMYLYSTTSYPQFTPPTLYCSGNIGPHRPDTSYDDWELVRIDGARDLSSPLRVNTPFSVPSIATDTASNVPVIVTSAAGAFPRDIVDQRLVAEYWAGTGSPLTGYADWLAWRAAQPMCIITSPLDGATTAGNPVTIEGTATDDSSVAQVAVRSNGGEWVTASGTTAWSCPLALDMGESTIEARAQDNEGKWGSSDSITVTRVREQPTCIITSPEDGATLVGNPITIQGTASDNSAVAQVLVRFNGGIWLKATGSTSWTRDVRLAQGENTVEARAQDDQGNWGPIDSITVNRIQAQPTCVITSPATGSTIAGNPVRVRGTASDNVAVERVIVRFNGGIWLKATGTTNWVRDLNLPLGTSLIEARARDSDGNWGQIVSISVYRIQGQPTCTITSPANGATVTGNPVLIQGTATDNGSIEKVVVRFNGGIWLKATGTTSWLRTVNLPLGANQVEARAQDNQGNWGPTVGITINRTAD